MNMFLTHGITSVPDILILNRVRFFHGVILLSDISSLCANILYLTAPQTINQIISYGNKKDQQANTIAYGIPYLKKYPQQHTHGKKPLGNGNLLTILPSDGIVIQTLTRSSEEINPCGIPLSLINL